MQSSIIESMAQDDNHLYGMLAVKNEKDRQSRSGKQRSLDAEYIRMFSHLQDEFSSLNTSGQKDVLFSFAKTLQSRVSNNLEKIMESNKQASLPEQKSE